MDNMELGSKKFMILLLVICVAFLVIIIKAFEFLPENKSVKVINENGINLPADETDTNQENTDENSLKTSSNMPIKINYSDEAPEIDDGAGAGVNRGGNVINSNLQTPKTESIPEGLEEIKEVDKTSSAIQVDTFETVMAKAYQLKQSKQYVQAIEEFNKVQNISKNPEEVAKSYEEIATIYAIVKRYGTALSFAQKAYNTYPSTSREMLLARLYYKTGDIDKSTKRINNVLQRDFASDR